jgi:aspartokinase-like uncharacterized kinase
MMVLIKLGALAMQLNLARAFVVKIRESPGHYQVVLFPGGGAFADLIRKEDHEYHIGEEAAHWLAIHAMDSTGVLLANTCPGLRQFTQLEDLEKYLYRSQTFASDGLPEVPIWLPHAWCRRADPTPHSWDVTSDSLAIFAGASLGVKWVGLAKITGELTKTLPFSASPRLSGTELQQMMAASRDAKNNEEWVVDPYLPHAIQKTKTACRVFDGRDIDNVGALLRDHPGSKYAEIRP